MMSRTGPLLFPLRTTRSGLQLADGQITRVRGPRSRIHILTATAISVCDLIEARLAPRAADARPEVTEPVGEQTERPTRQHTSTRESAVAEAREHRARDAAAGAS